VPTRPSRGQGRNASHATGGAPRTCRPKKSGARRPPTA
jgi:hypothetical protein